MLLLLSHFSHVRLCDPIDSRPPGSPVPGILQARTLGWVAIAFSNAWKWKVKVKSLSRVGLLVTPWTAAHQAPPSMGFSRQEDWSGVPLPSPIAFSSTHNCQQNIKSFLGKDKSYTSKTFFFYTQWLLLHLKLPDTAKHSTKLFKTNTKNSTKVDAHMIKTVLLKTLKQP